MFVLPASVDCRDHWHWAADPFDLARFDTEVICLSQLS